MRRAKPTASASGRGPRDPRPIRPAHPGSRHARHDPHPSRAQSTTEPGREVHARDTSRCGLEVRRDLSPVGRCIENVDRGEFLRAALAVPFAPRMLGGGAPVAFVTSDLESHVAVLDLETARVVRRIRTGPGPRSIESLHRYRAVVAHTEHGVVTLLDAATSRIRAELDSFEAPRYT